MSAKEGYLAAVSKSELIDSRTQKTIVQHNWLKDHVFVSEYGSHFKIVGLLGGGLSESYLAAFKLDAKGEPIRDRDSGRPRIERLAITPVVEQLNKHGIYAPFDPRSKAVSVESVEVEPMVAERDIDGEVPEMEDDEMDEVEEAVIPETVSRTARDKSETRLVAQIAHMTIRSRDKKAPGEILRTSENLGHEDLLS